MNSGEIWEEATRQACEAWQKQECVSVRREAKVPKVMSVWEDQPEGHVSHWEQWNKAGELWKKPGLTKAWLGASAWFWYSREASKLLINKNNPRWTTEKEGYMGSKANQVDTRS